MGLDQYLYRVSALTDRELKAIQYREVFSLPDNISFMECDSENVHLLNEIKDYCRKVILIPVKTDFTQMKNDYGIPETAKIIGSCYHPEGCKYDFQFSKENNKITKIVELTSAQEDMYLYREPVEFYVFKTEGIGYWRKNHVLNDKMEEISPIFIDNCKYIPCTEEMLQLCVDKGVTYEAIENDENSDSVICYYIWY